jgi:hypothetical protein
MRLISVALLLMQKEMFKAGSVLHTSTKFFGCMKIFGGNCGEARFRTRIPCAVKCPAGNCRANDANGLKKFPDGSGGLIVSGEFPSHRCYAILNKSVAGLSAAKATNRVAGAARCLRPDWFLAGHILERQLPGP